MKYVLFAVIPLLVSGMAFADPYRNPYSDSYGDPYPASTSGSGSYANYGDNLYSNPYGNAYSTPYRDLRDMLSTQHRDQQAPKPYSEGYYSGRDEQHSRHTRNR